MRVLLLAEQCNPEWPSLPLVGFNLCRALARRLDVVVATHVRNRADLQAGGIDGEVVFLDNEYIARPMYRAATWIRRGDAVGWTTNVAMAYLPYLAFEREVLRRFGSDLRAGRFDLVHRVTPMSPTLPSFAAGRLPVPFVLGPLNGGLPWPPAFRAELHREREWLTHARNAYRLLPFYRSTYRRAARILAAFPHTIADLPAETRTRCVDLPEVGIDPERFEAPPPRPDRAALTLLFVGRLVPYKCPDVALRAFLESEALRRHRLLFVGDGPERPALERLCAEHGVGDQVRFLGARPQHEVARFMRDADLFVFPSIRELGGGVVVEAMACGLPCVVVDYGGPGGLVDASSGIKVPLGSKPALIARTRSALEQLVADRGLRLALGERARARAVREYAWSAKAEKIETIYRELCTSPAASPLHQRAAKS
jgi:glycosyltransferase involved in cell wall biosynthesis